MLARRYLVQQYLKTGGMGSVFRAYDRQTSREVAIKEVHVGEPNLQSDEMKERLLREAQVLRALQHPQIPEIIDGFFEGGCCLIVMDYVEGPNLEDLVGGMLSQTGAAMPGDRVIDCGLQVCRILKYLHEQPGGPVIHRDIKPSNLIMRRKQLGSDLVLIDFGLARSADKSKSTMSAVGSLRYVSPEQIEGHAEVRSDLYSLGATLFFLVTGRHPTPLQPCRLQSESAPLREELVAFIEKATQQNPDDRFASAAEMEKALTEMLPSSGQPEQSPLVEEPVEVAAGPKWTVSLSLAYATMLLLLMGGVLWIWTLQQKAAPIQAAVRPPLTNADQPPPVEYFQRQHEAIDLALRKNYDAAIPKLLDNWKTHPDYQVAFYLFQSYQATEKQPARGSDAYQWATRVQAMAPRSFMTSLAEQYLKRAH